MSRKDDYLKLLQSLLPRGQAWNREPDSVLTALLSVVATILAEIDARAAKIIGEADPRTTFEMLEDWERAAALPDSCTGGAQTLQERHDVLVQRVASVGGQSIAYFKEVAAAIGYDDIEIVEYKPFICGISRCGDPLNGGHDTRFNWSVEIKGPRLTYFRCGQSACGDRLLEIDRAEDLECVFTRLKPAHTNLIFSYTGE